MIKKCTRVVTVWILMVSLLLFAVPAQVKAADSQVDNLEYLRAVMEMIKESYQGDITDEELISGALKGMFDTMDIYTTYMSRDEAEDFLGDISGTYEGIGVTMKKSGKFIEVIRVFESSPAEKAGIYPGDRIASVNGINVAEATLEEANNLIRGPSGTEVALEVVRGDDVTNIKVSRGKIEYNPVSYKINDDIGYIKVESFNANSSSAVEKALREMNKNRVKKIILDLRDNPGGDVEQAVAIAGMFVPRGLITKLDFKSENTPDVEYTSSLKSKKYELAVLVNNMSASASEIVAGAVQDRKAGVLIGTKTFGKAKVQRTIPLLTPEAFEKYKNLLGEDITSAYDLIFVHNIIPLDREIIGYVKMTIGMYTTPNGRMIDLKGIEPDIVVEDPETDSEVDVRMLDKLSKTEKPTIGSEGADVYYAESILKLLGYDIDDPDSKYDKKTFEAVKQFQKEKGGYSYGVLDFTTQQWLNEELDRLLLELDKQYAKAVEVLK